MRASILWHRNVRNVDDAPSPDYGNDVVFVSVKVGEGGRKEERVQRKELYDYVFNCQYSINKNKELFIYPFL